MTKSPWLTKFDDIKGSVRPKKLLMAGPEKITYGDLFSAIGKMTTHCRDLGIESGDRVLIATGNDKAMILLFFSFLRLGIVSVIVDPGAGTTEARTLIKSADPKAIFAEEKFLDRVKDILATGGMSVTRIEAGETGGGGLLGRFLGRSTGPALTFPDLLDNLEESEPEAEPDADDTAYILFTSGTTSQPKGVEITHGNLFAQEQTFVRQYQFDGSVELLNVLPMFHTDGLTHGPVLAFTAGATVHRPVPFRVDTLEHILRSIYTLQITHFITVPAVLSLIEGAGQTYQDCFRTDDFRFLISTAAFLDPKLWRSIEEQFGIRVVNVYGLTETVCEALYCGPDDETRRIGTVGKPVDCEARIIDPDGKEVAQGEVGELALKGDHVMRGYFRQPEETAKVLRDGWFHTGDLAKVDADGFYHIVGRKKNVIITAGINVYPEDVTSVVRDMKGVIDAVTFGLEDETWGERVVTCIESANGQTLTQEDVAEHCRENLAREKCPNKIYFMDELPRGPAGKVLLNEVKDFARAQMANASSESFEGNIQERLMQIAARQFKTSADHLDRGSNPDNTAGWNSLAHVEFLIAIENQFDIKISPREFMNIASIGDAVDIVQDKCRDTAG